MEKVCVIELAAQTLAYCVPSANPAVVANPFIFPELELLTEAILGSVLIPVMLMPV
jgi:hypothetical protein